MNWFGEVRNPARSVLVLVMVVFCASAQQQLKRAILSPAQGPNAPAKRAPYMKAFVVDDRLSTLRREPTLQSEVIHRLRLGRPVFVVGGRSDVQGQPKFYRIAVTRRTRGWILESALALQSRSGEDQRVMKLSESASDGLDRIVLCRLLIERFSQSPLIAPALMLIGREAERVAETLSQRARKRLADAGAENASATSRDYYLSDVSLDRYSKLHVAFDFNESLGEYVYDGKAYREVVRRFPNGAEAKLARERLELVSQKMARRQ